ncbi:hypothetical protein K458DRAFT_425230 [Lentithecium fluviatile CBS 122367]|uniref:F-box domain-containing protein n=1 Tax=Lentithecium fluviatile CBS 122367 TaxID=1168545 RepID=A0A6G1IC21_9PLEO|nr:hypothetical protein K458DRAFT_425230 [Lentithecium fluviatile CBS 122367]
MAETSLMGMPLELLVHIIATYLPTKDLGALRLTSKYLEKALFDTFAKEFFTKKQFMLSTPSLDVLVRISKHAALAPFVKHVIVGLDQYGPSPSYHIWQTVAQVESYRNGWADQCTLSSSGRDREMLAEAFRNLPNLDTIGIRDYCADGRVRDDNRWRSYGAPTVQQQTGVGFNTSSSDYATKVFPMLLQALADANKHIPSIEVILRTHGTGLGDFAFFVPSADTKLVPVLDGLQQLLLTLSSGESRGFFLHNLTGPSLNGLGPARSFSVPTLLEAFLLQTSSLRHLRLNFQRHQSENTEYILERLSMANNPLPKLERLDFGMMETTPDLLLQVISKFSTSLRHIGLWKVDLFPSVLPRWKDAEGRFNPWPRLLKDLLKLPNLALTGIILGCLTHYRNISYPPVKVNWANGKVSQERSGDMQVFLPPLVDDLRVQWPRASAPDPDEDEEMEEDDDDDGEDDDDDDDEIYYLHY